MSNSPYIAGQASVEPFHRAAVRFRDGSDTPSAYLERRIAVMLAREPGLRAFVERDVESARAAAEASTARYSAGAPLSAVDGMPVGIKDVIETRDFATQMNSRRFEGWHSMRDAACVAALREGGAIILGKTVTTEFSLGDSGPTTNPWNSAHTPGGSSSGSAAAVAAGMAAAALGTQEIGSLIRPASFCGVLGFKPTFGVMHQGGVHGVAPSQSHLGLLAGSLQDLVAVGARIADAAGGDPGYPALICPPLPVVPERPARIALIRTVLWPRMTPAARDAFDTFTAELHRRGLEVQDADIDPAIAAFERDSANAHDVWATICCWELRWPLLQYRNASPQAVGETTARFIAMGEKLTPRDYEVALELREAMRAAYRALIATFDTLLMPSATGAAPAGLASTGSREFNAFSSGFGVPAISLPLLACDGLPLGVQLLGPHGGDALLLRRAAWLLSEFAPALL